MLSRWENTSIKKSQAFDILYRYDAPKHPSNTVQIKPVITFIQASPIRHKIYEHHSKDKPFESKVSSDIPFYLTSALFEWLNASNGTQSDFLEAEAVQNYNEITPKAAVKHLFYYYMLSLSVLELLCNLCLYVRERDRDNESRHSPILLFCGVLKWFLKLQSEFFFSQCIEEIMQPCW